MGVEELPARRAPSKSAIAHGYTQIEQILTDVGGVVATSIRRIGPLTTHCWDFDMALAHTDTACSAASTSGSLGRAIGVTAARTPKLPTTVAVVATALERYFLIIPYHDPLDGGCSLAHPAARLILNNLPDTMDITILVISG
jgi:hypothetical protein